MGKSKQPHAMSKDVMGSMEICQVLGLVVSWPGSSPSVTSTSTAEIYHLQILFLPICQMNLDRYPPARTSGLSMESAWEEVAEGLARAALLRWHGCSLCHLRTRTG